MILILVAIITTLAFGTLMFKLGDEIYGAGGTFMAICGIVLCFAGGIAAIVYPFAAWSWFASDYQAKIINREYGTHYTREEVFYASNVIDTVRELDRKRIEVNGDVMRPSAD